MTTQQMILTIAAVVFGTMITRFLAFILFPTSKTPPAFVQYLGKMLPSAVMGLLVIYSFKNFQLTATPENMAAIIASVVLIAIHLWKRHLLLSIASGTILYMVCLQLLR